MNPIAGPGEVEAEEAGTADSFKECIQGTPYSALMELTGNSPIQACNPAANRLHREKARNQGFPRLQV